MKDENEQNEIARSVQFGLLAIAWISVVCALLHASSLGQFDEKTAMFLALAMVALVIPQITKFKGFGFEIEKVVNQLKEDVKSVEIAVGGLEKDVGPGSRTASAKITMAVPVAATATSDAARVDPEDPNKGQYGGLSEVPGRKLTATIEPIAGAKSSRCRVSIRVLSTDPGRPLVGTVKLYLHPTFGQWSSYNIQARDSVAEATIVSYGAFTVGAEADDGKTRLELDLMRVAGGTKQFYEA